MSERRRNALAERMDRERKAREYQREMRARRIEMLRASGGGPTLRALKPINDGEMFETVMYALLNSDLQSGYWEPGGAPSFAALLVRIAEQTVAEFGERAACEAFERIAEAISPPPRLTPP